jgi:hypothetical protein
MSADLTGARVLIIGEHPWTGHSGTVLEAMTTSIGRGWRVELDDSDGMRSYVENVNLHITRRPA